MAVKIRLKRMGKIRQPYYRVVVVDSRKKRDGKVIEEIGKYHPKEEPSFIEVVSDRAQYWLGVGAQPSEAVEAILKVTGDWQKFKGLPGTEGTLQHQGGQARQAGDLQRGAQGRGQRAEGQAVTKKAPRRRPSKPAEPAPRPRPRPAEAAAETAAEEPTRPRPTSPRRPPSPPPTPTTEAPKPDEKSDEKSEA